MILNIQQLHKQFAHSKCILISEISSVPFGHTEEIHKIWCWQTLMYMTTDLLLYSLQRKGVSLQKLHKAVISAPGWSSHLMPVTLQFYTLCMIIQESSTFKHPGISPADNQLRTWYQTENRNSSICRLLYIAPKTRTIPISNPTKILSFLTHRKLMTNLNYSAHLHWIITLLQKDQFCQWPWSLAFQGQLFSHRKNSWTHMEFCQ